MLSTAFQGHSRWGQTFCASVLTAKQFIRKMRGGSQSILVKCSNGQYAIVKMRGNPQGTNVLANEVIGGVVLSTAGLPVAQGCQVDLTEDFIDQNPGLWFGTSEGYSRPESGLHFGSLFIGGPEGIQRPTDYISRSKISSISNRAAFLGMYILDVWANHQDSRQAILLPHQRSHSEILFIDNGHMFAGPDWNFSERPGIAFHLERSIYSDLWDTSQVIHWISHFEIVLPDALSEAISLLPKQWYKGSVRILQHELLRRLTKLSELTEEDKARSHRLVQWGTPNDTVQLPHFGIRMVGVAV